MYVLKDAKSLRAFVEQILKFKELVKCPLCLDIVKNPVQVGCAHTFCSDCLISFESYFSTKVHCPICRKIVIKRHKNPNCEMEHLSQFVASVSNKLKTVFGVKDLTMIKIDESDKLGTFEDRQLVVDTNSSSSNHNTESTGIIPATVCDKPVLKYENKSKLERKKQKAKVNDTIEKSLLKEDAFDLLTAETNADRYRNIRTYSRIIKPTVKIETFDKLIDFEDARVKTKIIQWLTDGRNYFERVTQTQQESADSDSVQSFDMASISQDHVEYMKNYDDKMKKLRKSRADFTNKSIPTRRARSLDITIKDSFKRPLLKRHSFACETIEFEDVNIEEVESEPDLYVNDIIHLAEEDCLNSLQSEHVTNEMKLKKLSANEKEGERREIVENINDGGDESGQNLKGWPRIKETKKITKRTERKLKKLNVSCTQVDAKSKSKAEGTGSKRVTKQPVVVLENLKSSVEVYFDDDTGTSAGKMLFNFDVHKDLSREKIFEIVIGNDRQKGENDLVPQINTVENIPDVSDLMCNSKNLVPESVAVGKLCNNKKSQQNVESVNDEHLVKRQPLKTATVDEVFGDTERGEVSVRKGFQTNDEDIFMQTTQKLDSNCEYDLEAKLEAIFRSPSKEDNCRTSLNENEDEECSDLQSTINLGNNLLNEFNGVLLQNVNKLWSSGNCSPDDLTLTRYLNKIQTFVASTRMVLRDIEQLSHSIVKNKSVNTSITLPKTPDILNVSCSKTATEPKNISDVTTQTVSSNLNCVAVQTDDIKSPGFRISSSASFKTQVTCQSHAETQTDPLVCANCRCVHTLATGDVVTRSTGARTPSEILLHDRDVIRVLNEKYEFTQSLDNMQFDTQDFVAKKTSGSKRKKNETVRPSHSHESREDLSRPSSSSNKGEKFRVVGQYELTQSLDNIQVSTCEIVESAVGRQKKGEIVALQNENNLNTDEDRKSSHNKGLNLPNGYDFSQSLDDVQFKTPDVEQEETTVKKKVTSQSSKNKLGENKHPECIKSNNGSNLMCSVSIDTQDQKIRQVNRRLEFPDVVKKYKRIRPPTSDSDSDGENPRKFTKLDGRCVQDDVTINFISEPFSEEVRAKHDKKADETLSLSVGGSENINYDEYLEKIMKKYENEVPSSTLQAGASKNIQTTNKPIAVVVKRTTGQDIVEKCEALIREATSKRSFCKAQADNKCDMHETIEDVEAVVGIDWEGFNVPLSNCKNQKRTIENKDETKGTPTKVKRTENFSESIFSNAENASNVTNLLAEKLDSMRVRRDENTASLESVVDEFKRHMENALQNKPDLINKEQVNEAGDCKKIVILQNIVIKKKELGDLGVKKELQYDLDEELAKLEDKEDVRSVRSEEIFTSESEDVDVVETTPQKVTSLRFSSPSPQRIKQQIILPPPEVASSLDPPQISSFLDVALPPPLEFQDFQEHNDENDKNSLNLSCSLDLDATLVPNMSFKSNMRTDDVNFCKTVTATVHNQFGRRVGVETSTPFLCDSTLPKSLAVSPIQSERKTLNPLDVAQNCRFSPLDIVVVKSQSQKSVVTTSTPKQKSILSYVRTSQTSSRNDVNNSAVSVISVDSTEANHTPVKKLKPCIACTRLSKDQLIAVSALINKKLATYSGSFNPNVTHMIVTVNDKKCVKDHTIKFVCAVAAGTWVLSFKWIQECLLQNRIVAEEPYEALDVSGVAGPKIARLTRLENPLFKGYVIHVAPPFLSTAQKDVESVLTMLGGKVVPRPDCLLESDGIRIIITEARATQDFQIYETWLETLHVITADIEWLSRSVGQYQPLSLRPFALCSDEGIDNISSNYPPELLVNTPFSFSQSTSS